MIPEDAVTWLGQPHGVYRIAATVDRVTPKGMVWIRVVRPSPTIPERKLVVAESLLPGHPETEIRWD